MKSSTQRVLVIGAGVGGLACAIDLAASGLAVTVLDRAPATGGKLRTVEVGGLHVDAGPTVLTMRWVFDELFAVAGRRLADSVRLEASEVLARHAWPGGATLDLFADPARSAEAIGALAGPDEARRFLAFCDYTRRIYETVEGPFLRSQRPTFADLLKQSGTLGLGALSRIDAHRTMAKAVDSHFRDARLRQLFSRYATYCGSSPYEAPATLNLIAHVEAEGVHRVVGGMGKLAAALRSLAEGLGVEIRCGAEVASVLVSGGRAEGVVLASGERIYAPAVVANTDVAALSSGLLGEGAKRSVKRADVGSRSLSAVTLALAARPSGLPLVHHNVFFSDDYSAEFKALAAGRVPDEPTVYLCAQDRGDDPRAAGAPERMLIIVNAPATGDEPNRWTHEERQRCERITAAAMARCGVTLEVSDRALTTPVEWNRLFPGTGGALYGASARGPLSSLSREGAKTRLPGLYLAGGSVHPGPGVPMAALSGRLAADCVKADLASTARSRRAVTSGSIWTA